MSTPTLDTTTNYALPLPHPGNEGADDCLRLRQALSGVDAALKTIADEVESKADVSALEAKADAAVVSLALEGIAAEMATVNTSLSQKADASTVNTSLAEKATIVDVTTHTADLAAHGLDATVAEINSALSKKSNAATVTAELAKKADKAATEAAFTQNTTEHATLAADIEAAANAATWGGLSGKPETFPPAGHRHSFSDLDGAPEIAPASTTTAGVIRIATPAEADAGTATNCAVTPAHLLAALPNLIDITEFSGPSSAPIGYPATFSLTAESALLRGAVASFTVSGPGMEPQTIPATNGTGTLEYTAPAGTPVGQPLTLRAVATDNSGYKSTPVEKTVNAVRALVNKPVIIAPEEGAIVNPVSIPLMSTAFATTGSADTQVAAKWRICTDAAGTNTLWNSGRSTTAKTSITATPAAGTLTPGATVFAFVTHEGAKLGESMESAPVTLVVAQVFAPTITSPTANATGVPVKPQIVMTPYEATGSLDSGENTRVQVATDNTFANIVYDSGKLAYTTTHAVVTALPPAAGACVRVQHKGALLGWTPWSEGVSFTTGAVQTPVIEAPNASSGILPPTFTVTGSAFSAIGATDTLKAVRIQVAKDIAFTNLVYNQRTVTASTTNTITITAQAGSPTLHLRMLYEGNALGESEFSDAVQILVSPVLAPTITSPVEGATLAYKNLTIVTAPIALTVGYTDTFSNADYTIYDPAGAVVASATNIASTSHVFADPPVAGGQFYDIGVVHRGTIYGASPKSAKRRIKIKPTRHGEILYDTSGNPAAVITGSYASNGGKPWTIRGKQVWLAVALAAKRSVSIAWNTSGADTNFQDISSIENPGTNWQLASNNTGADGNSSYVSTQSTEAHMDGSFTYSQAIKDSKALTDAIVAHNANYQAAKTARQLVLKDLGAMDLPRIEALMRIYQMRDKIDALDPTASANTAKKLAAWGFGSADGAHVWSASENGSAHAWNVYSNGYLNDNGKYNQFGVVPALEIPA